MADVTFEQLPTGRTHQVKGEYQPILDEAGEPETEWVLVANVNGHRVPLQSYSVGYVEHMVGRDDTAIDASATSASEGSGTADAGDEADQLRARVAELEAQLAQQGGGSEQQPPAPASAGDQTPQQ